MVGDLERRGIRAEIIMVDDGSLDRTGDLLRIAVGTRPYLKSLHLARNFGQTAAMAAGFDAARGSVVIPLDADLQNDPADVEALLAKLDQGYDVVSGWRRQRQDLFVTRKVPSWLATNRFDLGCVGGAPPRLRLYPQGISSGCAAGFCTSTARCIGSFPSMRRSGEPGSLRSRSTTTLVATARPSTGWAECPT